MLAVGFPWVRRKRGPTVAANFDWPIESRHQFNDTAGGERVSHATKPGRSDNILQYKMRSILETREYRPQFVLRRLASSQ